MPSRVAAWKKAKTAFEKATNKSKPSDKVLGVVRTGIGIEAALKTVDQLEPNAHASSKNLEKFTKAVNKYLAAKDRYLTTLESAVKKNHKGVDQATYLRGVTVLKTQLTAIQTSLLAATLAKKTTVATRDQLHREFLRIQLLVFAAADEAQAFGSRVKASPQPDTFNDGVQAVAQGFVACLVEFRPHVKTATRLEVLPKLTSQFESAGRYFGQLKGPRPALPATASRTEVRKETRRVESAAAVMRAWADTELLRLFAA